MVRGVAGVVTDGGFRDAPEIANLPFPAYHNRPSAPTNLTLHQALDINVPIGCGDVAVWPGDVVVGDREGVEVVAAVPAAAVILLGCVVMAGAVTPPVTVKVTALLVTEPMLLVATTV